MIDRTERVLNALGRRIAAQGDMRIRVSRHTFRVLMRAVGVGHWEDREEFREIDALALDILRHFSWKVSSYERPYHRQ
ncbi:hypothetical protein GGR39_002388 [Novosphingobium fluoreni]|uniref:Uncharacterized protein n=1 Tax=Novosphingobium fluoreni TaxID=1391222 RepID=A0A7W6BZH6_9SPHN|nr:hypothetical protein [Novosphingobium fluoreni]MBB3940731.1 hypothetical protein [Novosphingobium fluoreni]